MLPDRVITRGGRCCVAYDGISVEEFEAKADAFLHTAQHPTLGHSYLQCAYLPLIELLGHLDANGFSNGSITHKAEADYVDDGPEKPIRIWSRTGRRPILAAGNSDGDIPMLESPGTRTSPHFAC